MKEKENLEKIHRELLKKVSIYYSYKIDMCDEEFYYAVGQLSHYLVSLGYSQNFDLMKVDPIVIKKAIEKFMKKYARDIKIKSKIEVFRIANLLSLIFAHQSQNDKIYEEYFLAGLMNEENVICEKLLTHT